MWQYMILKACKSSYQKKKHVNHDSTLITVDYVNSHINSWKSLILRILCLTRDLSVFTNTINIHQCRCGCVTIKCNKQKVMCEKHNTFILVLNFSSTHVQEENDEQEKFHQIQEVNPSFPRTHNHNKRDNIIILKRIDNNTLF